MSLERLVLEDVYLKTLLLTKMEYLKTSGNVCLADVMGKVYSRCLMFIQSRTLEDV